MNDFRDKLRHREGRNIVYDENWALAQAMEMANYSLCGKSKRGVVIWNPRALQYVGGWNAPPMTFFCEGSETCEQFCGKLCVHAEQQALLKARDLLDKEVEMLHIKVVNFLPVPSDKPSCLECSKLILDSGIKAMWLLLESGLTCYTAREFHQETIKNVLGRDNYHKLCKPLTRTIKGKK